MNATTLKTIALISMTIDHIGFFLLPSDSIIYLVCRIIGRIAFPIFAFMIAQGFLHTKNRRNYALRLFIFALIVEVIFILLYFYTSINYSIIPLGDGYAFSIAWTLLVGLIGLMVLHSKHKGLYILLIPLVVLSYFLQYSFYGFLMILLFGLKLSMDKKINYFNILTLGFVFYPLLLGSDFTEVNTVQLFALAALGFIYLYNGEKGKGYRYMFYIYYPLHIVILFLIAYWFNFI